MKDRINMRFDHKLLTAVDSFIKKLVPKKKRTQFVEEATKDHLRREKAKLRREQQ